MCKVRTLSLSYSCRIKDKCSDASREDIEFGENTGGLEMSGEQTHRSPGTQYSTAVVPARELHRVGYPESRIQIIYIIDTVHVRVLAMRTDGRVDGGTVLPGGCSWDEGNDKGPPHLLWPIREHTLNTTRRVASAKGDQCK